jgi:pimeloyl-ACP methyl ester carboxylesterase
MVTATKAWTEKYVQLSHGKTRYLEAGRGYPTILIHGAGWTSGAESWAANIGPLSGQLRVLAIDALNWGLGDVLSVEFSFAYLVDHVREFMDALGIPKANVVGHSMGGWLVTLLSYESPDRVNKVINVAGGGTATRPLQNMVQFQVPTPEQIRQQLEHRYAPGSVDLDEIVASVSKKNDLPGHADAFAGVMRHMTNPPTRQRYNTLRRMPFITAPTLVLWGRDDETNALEMGEATAKAIPGAKLVVFDNVGHMLPQQKPDEFNKVVLGFLAD